MNKNLTATYKMRHVCQHLKIVGTGSKRHRETKKNNREREIVFSQRRWKMNLSLQSHSVLKLWFVQIVTNSFRVYFLVSCFSFIFFHLISYFEILFILFRFYLCDVFLAVCARFSACFTSVKANFPSPRLIIFS